MSTQCSTRPTGDGHESPCPWSKAMMWVAAVLISVAIYAAGNLSARTSNLEKSNAETRELLAALRASMEYVQRDLSEIKATLRRDEVARKSVP